MTWSGMRGLVTLILALSIPMIDGMEQAREDAIVMMIRFCSLPLWCPD